MSSNATRATAAATIDLTTHGSLRVDTFPPTSVSMRLASYDLQGRTLSVHLSGNAENVNTGTACALHYTISTTASLATPHAFSSGNPPKLDGTSLTESIDLLDAEAFGECSLVITALPDVPFADETPVTGEIDLKLPLTVQVTPEGDPSAPLVGTLVTLTPVADQAWDSCALRLTVIEEVSASAKKAPRETATYVWEPGDREARQWRVGCTDADGSVLSYPEPEATGKAAYAVGFRLEIADKSQTSWHLVWERRGTWTVPRPTLTSVTLGLDEDLAAAIADQDSIVARLLGLVLGRGHVVISATLCVDQLADGYLLPLEAQLWGYHPLTANTSAVEYVIEPLAPVVPAHVSGGNGTEVALVDLSRLSEAALASYAQQQVFVVLSAPPAATATDASLPLCEVVDYDETVFPPFDDEELAIVVPPKATPSKKAKARQPRAVPGKTTPKALGIAVASLSMQGLRGTRLPDFGVVAFGSRGDSLLVQTRVAGPLDYWKAAAPTVTLQGPTAQGPASKPLPLKASKTDPRLFEATVAMRDVRQLFTPGDPAGAMLTATAQVTVQNIQVQDLGTVPDAAPRTSAPLSCVPWLSPLTVVDMRTGDANGVAYLAVSCRARFLPGGPSATEGLGVRIMETVTGRSGTLCVQREDIRVHYDMPLPKGYGRCDEAGRFSAHIHDPAILTRLSDGQFRVEVYRPSAYKGTPGKYLELDVPIVSADLTGTARDVTGKVIWGDKVSDAFIAGIEELAQRLQVDPNYLMACMAFETGRTFSPSVKNPKSGFVGLIQFGPAAAQLAGTTVAQLASMQAAEDQLPYVKAYFQAMAGQGHTPRNEIEDVYMVIFCPSGVGADLEAPLYTSGTKAYDQNSGLDPNGTGVITKRMAGAAVRAIYQEGFAHIR